MFLASMPESRSYSAGDCLIAKLDAFTRLDADDAAAIRTMAAHSVRMLRPGDDLISEGDAPKTVNLVLEGWACRYKMLDDGRRQILAFFVPGDLADLNVYILKEMDHSIAAITSVRYAAVGPAEFEAVENSRPRIMRAFWWEALVTSAIQREWLVSAGQRTALESLAHLTCELFLRLRTIDRVSGNRCDLPLKQADIGDALGLTQPHVSRTLRSLNATRLVTIHRGTLMVHDLGGLMRLAAFNPNYLHHLYDPAQPGWRRIDSEAV
jgi:CRP-like cAMP-binding protein